MHDELDFWSPCSIPERYKVHFCSNADPSNIALEEEGDLKFVCNYVMNSIENRTMANIYLSIFALPESSQGDVHVHGSYGPEWALA